MRPTAFAFALLLVTGLGLSADPPAGPSVRHYYAEVGEVVQVDGVRFLIDRVIVSAKGPEVMFTRLPEGWTPQR